MGRQSRVQLEAYKIIYQGQVISTWGQCWKKEENKSILKEPQKLQKKSRDNVDGIVLDSHTAQSNIQIQCNPYQNYKGIFHINITNNPTFVWNHKRP